MSVDFGRNADDKIGMKLSRTIRIPHPHITRTSQVSFNIFDTFSRTLDISYRDSPWNGPAKSESKNLGGNKFFENDERENNSEV